MAHSQFAATRWTVVMAAGRGDTGAERALSELAQAYWFPLYAFIRRQGHGAAEAEDLTQAFFARLLEKESLRQVERGKGKFRSFLLTCVQNFLLNEGDKERAAKRGGGKRVVALDGLEAEARYAMEPADEMTAERLFEQRWAWAVLDKVLGRLREQYRANGQEAVFEALKGMLMDGGKPAAEVGAGLGMSAGAVDVAGHRLRRRYRALLREEIAQTVEEAGMVEEEIRYLRSCL